MAVEDNFNLLGLQANIDQSLHANNNDIGNTDVDVDVKDNVLRWLALTLRECQPVA